MYFVVVVVAVNIIVVCNGQFDMHELIVFITMIGFKILCFELCGKL